MQAGFSDDQLQFRSVVAKFLADKAPVSAVRALLDSDTGFDARVWQQLSGELGLAGLHLPAACGGQGFGPVELGLILQEMGRGLYCGPFFSSAVMAGSALLTLASAEHAQRLLPALADGSQTAALVLDHVSRSEQVGSVLSVRNGQLQGEAALIIDAHTADRLLVVAREDASLGLFEVAPDVATITPQQSLDPTRRLSRVTFANSPAIPLGRFAQPQLEQLWDQLSTALAHEMVGGAEHLFESTVDYMKLRVQFGRAIGSFQALKHRCADLLLELELAKAITHAAARFLASGEGDATSPSMAKSLASDAYMSIARQAIQLRGGIGFTWEEDTHLWFKRAKSSEVFLGTPAWHRERVIARMEATAHV